jgi:hypothetical protein
MKDLFKSKNYGQLILGCLFIIYLLMGNKTPPYIAEIINSLPGKVLLFVIIIALFLYSNPILATIALFVGFELMRRSGSYSDNSDLINSIHQSIPNMAPIPEYPIQVQENNSGNFTELNQFPYTLEQEVVKKMVPLNNSGKDSSPASYKPILEDLYDASPVSQTN